MSRHYDSDLNPILAVSNATLNLISEGKLPQNTLNIT